MPIKLIYSSDFCQKRALVGGNFVSAEDRFLEFIRNLGRTIRKHFHHSKTVDSV